jgi:predicted amidophosphoribosyltransferase
MAQHIRPKPGLVLSSSHVVRALDLHGPRYKCGGCGSKMFVKYDSGLCPRCFNRAKQADSSASEVLYDFERLGTEDLVSD